MELTDFIAAVDLGTSKIAGVVAARKPDGILQVCAIEQEEADSCIKRGCIQNVDETANKLSRLIQKLETGANCRIGKIYVGLGGQSLQSVDNKVTRNLDDEAPITDRIIDSLKEESRSMPVNNKEILDIIPLEYLVDNKRVSQPVGVYATEIEANHKVIVGRPALSKNIRRVLERVGIEAAGIILSPIAASCVLSENEKSLGCVLVDCGAGTTTVSIYKEGLLRHLSVIPLGGHVITRDITTLKLLEKDAEKVKIEHGSADPSTANDVGKKLQRDGSPEIQVAQLNHAIIAREEEIIENIAYQMKQAGFDMNKLSAGFVLTGGASAMKGLPELFTKQTDMSVKFGHVQKNIDYGRYIDADRSGNLAVLIGLALRATENCAKEPEPVAEAETAQQGETIVIGSEGEAQTAAAEAHTAAAEASGATPSAATEAEAAAQTAATHSTVKEPEAHYTVKDPEQEETQEQKPTEEKKEEQQQEHKPFSGGWINQGGHSHGGLRGWGKAFLEIFSDDSSTKRD
jgi:cell division protein FtsA